MRIFNVGKPKKASLDLSLNAIVILILAIAILGLGLTFIRGIFKGITAKVEEAVSAGEITNPPTRDTPVTITPSTISVRQGETGQVKVAFMNVQTDQREMFLELYEIGVGVTPECDTSTTTCEARPVYQGNSLMMVKDQINIWTIAIAPASNPGGSIPGTYLYTARMICKEGTGTGQCPIAAPEEYSRDFILTIKP